MNLYQISYKFLSISQQEEESRKTQETMDKLILNLKVEQVVMMMMSAVVMVHDRLIMKCEFV
jgi:hypothetical protein